MVAHLAGAMTGSTSLREFVRQNVTHPYIKEADNPVDGTNRASNWKNVPTRAQKKSSPNFAKTGLMAIRNRQKLPWLVRNIPIPETKNFGYLDGHHLPA